MVSVNTKKGMAPQPSGSGPGRQTRKDMRARLQNMTEISLQHVLDNAGHGLRIINKDFTVCQINRAFSELSGITADEAVGKKCWQVFKGPFCKTPDCRLKRIIEGEEVLRTETVRTKRDGTTVPCIVTASAMRNKGGGLVGIAETFRDITDYRQLQTRIRESEDNYRALIELGTNIGEAVVVLQDVDSREAMHTYVSDQWPSITGYTREELLGMSFFDLAIPQDKEASMARHRLKMSGKPIPDLFEISIIAKNGKEVPIELTSAATIYAGNPANAVYIRDITQRRKLQEALQKSETLYRNAFETTDTATSILDGDGTILKVNREWESLYGYSKAEVQDQKNYLEFYQRDEVGRMDRYFRARLLDPNSVPAVYETSIIDKQGNTKYILTTVSMIPCTTQRVMSQMDITPQRQVHEQLIAHQEHLEEIVRERTSQLTLSNEKMRQEIERRKLTEIELRASRQALRDRNKRRIQFTRALVHELKTYLTPLVAAGELLETYASTETLKTLSLAIQSSVAGLDHRVDELLDLTRGEVGLLSLNCKWVNLKELSKRVCCDAKAEAERNGQVFEFESSGRLPRIWVDEDRLMQIMLNLLNNAFKYTPKGGRIGFRVRVSEQKTFFEVSDTGPGLNAEQLKHVFEPYWILQEKGRRIRGLGLGLPLAITLACLHGGRIAAKSQMGKGSIFTLIMPLEARVRTPKTRLPA